MLNVLPIPLRRLCASLSQLFLKIGMAAFLIAAIPVGAQAASDRVCFCHNVNHNPVDICTDNNALIEGHGNHVEKGADHFGRCDGCGNGVLDDGEACDDSNNQNGDGCNEDCGLEACGNGALDLDEGCDIGSSAADTCDAGTHCVAPGLEGECSCQENLPDCGDGNIDPEEQCDDGGTESGDGDDDETADPEPSPTSIPLGEPQNPDSDGPDSPDSDEPGFPKPVVPDSPMTFDPALEGGGCSLASSAAPASALDSLTFWLGSALAMTLWRRRYS